MQKSSIFDPFFGRMACASSDIHDTLNVLIALCRIVRPCHQWRIQKFFKGGPEKLQLPSKKFWGSFFSLKSQKIFNSSQKFSEDLFLVPNQKTILQLPSTLH